jgi:hypothetical protein
LNRRRGRAHPSHWEYDQTPPLSNVSVSLPNAHIFQQALFCPSSPLTSHTLYSRMPQILLRIDMSPSRRNPSHPHLNHFLQAICVLLSAPIYPDMHATACGHSMPIHSGIKKHILSSPSIQQFHQSLGGLPASHRQPSALLRGNQHSSKIISSLFHLWNHVSQYIAAFTPLGSCPVDVCSVVVPSASLRPSDARIRDPDWSAAPRSMQLRPIQIVDAAAVRREPGSCRCVREDVTRADPASRMYMGGGRD